MFQVAHTSEYFMLACASWWYAHTWYTQMVLCNLMWGFLKIWGNHKNPLNTQWPTTNWKPKVSQAHFPTLYCATSPHSWFFLFTQHRHMLCNINACCPKHLDSDLRLLCVVNWSVFMYILSSLFLEKDGGLIIVNKEF